MLHSMFVPMCGDNHFAFPDAYGIVYIYWSSFVPRTCELELKGRELLGLALPEDYSARAMYPLRGIFSSLIERCSEILGASAASAVSR